MKCPACNSGELRKAFRKNGFDVTVCQSCGHGSISPLPSEQDLKALYLRNQAINPNLEDGNADELEILLGHDEALFSGYFADRLEMLDGVPDLQSRSVLDYGCSSGLFVRALQYRGIGRASGVDIAAPLVERGRANGLDLAYDPDGRFLKSNPGKFDVICANNVLEHVPDPAGTLIQMRGALKDSGVIFLSVPNLASLQVLVSGDQSPIVDPPHHVHYFTPGSLEKTLQTAGFSVLRKRTLFWGRETDVFLTAKGLPAWLAALLRHLVIPLRFLIERKMRGGIIQALARKAETRAEWPSS